MEAQAHKDQEEALLNQTHALKIDLDQEQHTETKENDSLPPLDEVETILDYKFKNRHLLEKAFTHSTYYDENNSSLLSYERLEYVGDAVLNLLITNEQFFLYPDLHPGQLTHLRAANVNTEKLARVAIKYGLHRFLRHNKPQLGEQIQKFTKAIAEYPLHSNGLIESPKRLADIVESTIGAVFIDCDKSIDIVWKVFKKLLDPIINPDTIEKHPVTELHEVCQKNGLNLQFIDKWKESESVEVLINDELVGSGNYGSKKEIAHNRAAKNALENMERVLGISISTNKDALDELED